MKSFGAALAITAVMAGRATAQLPAPTPPPVPTYPLMVPQQPPTAEADIPSIEGLQVMPARGPALRIPTSFPALYSSRGPSGYVDPVKESRLVGGYAPQGCSSCDQGSCNAGFVCGPIGRVWGEVDYILWRASGDRVPALVTTSPPGTGSAQAGVLGSTGVSILAGNSRFSDDYRSGIRYNVGVWINPEQTLGVQVGGFFLDDGSTNASFASPGDPILARPFQNALGGAQASQLVALPGTLAGSVGADHRNSVSGFDAALRGNMCCTPCWRLDALLGYRYLCITDGLAIDENLTAGPNAPGALGVPVGTNILVADRFQTTNTFNGVQTGIAGEYRFWDRLFVSGTAKASFGYIGEGVSIAGATTVAVPGQAPVQNLGGLLALSSNIGRYERTHAALIPELNANLGLQLLPNVRLRAGYNLLYVNNIARPGNVMDTVVNPALIPPPVGNPLPARPAALAERNDFFLQGLSAGVEVRY